MKDYNIIGRGTINSGNYENIKILGECSIQGKVSVKVLDIQGKVNIKDDIKFETMKCDGYVNFTQSVMAKDFFLNGKMKANKLIKSNIFKCKFDSNSYAKSILANKITICKKKLQTNKKINIFNNKERNKQETSDVKFYCQNLKGRNIMANNLVVNKIEGDKIKLKNG